MAKNYVMFSELALGDVFSVVTKNEKLQNKFFVKIMRPNGKYGAIFLYDYTQAKANLPSNSAVVIVDDCYYFETNCASWLCQRETFTKVTNTEEKVISKEKETKLIGLYDDNSGKTIILKVTTEQLKVIYYMYNNGWLNFDDIVENPNVKVTDLTE